LQLNSCLWLDILSSHRFLLLSYLVCLWIESFPYFFPLLLQNLFIRIAHSNRQEAAFGIIFCCFLWVFATDFCFSSRMNERIYVRSRNAVIPTAFN
jgi:hypothetical protein